MRERDNKKRSADEFDVIKNDFIQALDRLINRAPRSTRNIQRVHEGKLDITLSSVAEEAGRSRSLIARSDTKYHEVRDLVLNYQEKTASRRKNAGSRYRKAMGENADLKKRLELSLEAQAQMLFEKVRAERESAKWLKAYRALQENIKNNGNIVSVVFEK